MREPAKLIQGGSTPSGTLLQLQQLPELSSKDVMYKNNHMYQFHQKIMCRTHTDLNDHYQKVH